MSACAFHSLPYREYSNLFIIISKSFSGKASLPVKNSFLLTFPDDKAEFSAVCHLNNIEICFARFCN